MLSEQPEKASSPLSFLTTTVRQSKELCPEHALRLTLYCLDCKAYMCDKCYVLENHVGHKTVQTSKMAHEVLEVFNRHFDGLEANLDVIDGLQPHLWKTKLRRKRGMIAAGMKRLHRSTRIGLTDRHTRSTAKGT